MQGDKKVIEYLNAQLKNELTAINQYFLHACAYKHWRTRDRKQADDESIGEMKHADWLIERVFMLDGLPNLQDLHKLLVGEETEEILKCDLKLEQISQSTCRKRSPTANRCVTTCRARSSKRSSTTPKSTSTGWKRRST